MAAAAWGVLPAIVDEEIFWGCAGIGQSSAGSRGSHAILLGGTETEGEIHIVAVGTTLVVSHLGGNASPNRGRLRSGGYGHLARRETLTHP
jgi:hypothetical protein